MDKSTSTYFFFSSNANLGNYVTMADFLTNKKVRKGHVALSIKRSELTMAAVVSNEIDPTALLEYACIKFHGNNDDSSDRNREALDQEFKIEDALRMSMLDADLLQTKRLKKKKTAISRALKTTNSPEHPQCLSPLETPPPVFPPSPPSTPEAEFIG